MKTRLVILSLLICCFSGCADLGFKGTTQHKIRLANADLAAALNQVEATVLSARQTGTISDADAVSASGVIYNLTLASDSIEKCVDTVAPGNGAVTACILPFVQTIRSQMTLAGLGIKSTTATNTFNAVIQGVVTTLQEIVTSEAGL